MESIKLSFKYPGYFKSELNKFFLQNEGKGFLYKLFTKKGEDRVAVGRIAGVDGEGILYIGQTIKPVDRLVLLLKSFQNPPPEGKGWKHGADEIYWQCEAVREKYPLENMFVEIIACDDSKAHEIEEISTYYRKFGEVPPFNGAIVKRRKPVI